jgi:hypothetical protein
MLPVLLICFARPKNLILMLDKQELDNRRIYVFVDSATEPGKIRDLNLAVLDVVHTHRRRDQIKLFQPPNNVGVKNAVPTAVEWAMSFENALIILEDDCIPKSEAFEFFDNQIKNLDSKRVMVCGTFPEHATIENSGGVMPQEAIYPLIWGWATTRPSWNVLRVGINRETVPWGQIIREIRRDPKKARGILFFTAAVIRANRGQLKAWDSPVALHMLINRLKAILPTLNLVINTGDDEVASHPPRSRVSQSKSAKKLENINENIESKIYNLRNRHLFSPIKAYLEPICFQIPKKIKILRKN